MTITQIARSMLAVSMTLFALGCGSPVSTAPEASESEPGQLPKLPDPLAAGWQGQQVCERLHEDTSQRVLRCTFPPGVGHERHFHAPHFGYVVVGSVMQITNESGTREVDLSTGTNWTSEGTAWHQVVNVGETTGVYLIVEPK